MYFLITQPVNGDTVLAFECESNELTEVRKEAIQLATKRAEPVFLVKRVKVAYPDS